MTSVSSTRPARGLALATLTLALLSPVTAGAQGAADPADALFQQAKERLALHDVDGACKLFAQSFAADPALGTLLNLAACHEKQGKIATAWSEFSTALARATSDANTQRADFARLHLAALEASLHRVVIEITTPATGMRVTIDGTALPREAWGTPVPLDPGQHRLEVSAEGRLPLSRDLSLGPSAGTDRIEVMLASAPPPVPVPVLVPPPLLPQKSAVPADPDRIPRTIGFVAVGLGVVGLGTAVAFAAQVLSNTATRDRLCAPGLPCSQQAAFDADHTARVDQDAMFVSGAIGVAAAGAGAALLVVSHGKARAASGFQLAPMVGPGNAGLDVRGTF